MKYFIDNNGDNHFIDITEEQEKFLNWCVENGIIDDSYTHIYKIGNDFFVAV